ncbi:MAG: glycosyltransferase family 4 protein [Pseudomonadales bacterium]|nr:glycosyltransferase family 4 protein [Pseudomonadales bacterium]
MPKTIVYFSSSTIPSLEANSIHVMLMAEALSQHGHQVTLIANRGSFNSIDDVYSQYGVSKNFTIRFCVRPTAPVVGSLIYGFFSALTCFRLGPKLLFARCPHSLFFSAIFNKPFIYEAHDLPKGRLRKFVETKLFRKTNFQRLVVISDALKRDYIREFSMLRDEDILVAHDGAKTSKDCFVPGYTKARTNFDKGLSVGYVGSLYAGKGVEGVIELAKERPMHRYKIVGGTSREIDIWMKKSPKNIEFHGRIDPSEVPAILRTFDVLLMPALNKIETSKGGNIAAYTSPLKMFEYMASGRPIISSNLHVLMEVLTDNFNALLAPPTDIAQWGIALDRLEKDTALRERLASNALEELRERYTWFKRAANVLTIIQ